MPNVKDIPNVTFDHPIEVQLANYPCKHRVLAVKRAKNPNGIGRGKHSYAVAEWFIGGKWKPVCDLVSQMRLANAVEHELGHNPEKYANFEGARHWVKCDSTFESSITPRPVKRTFAFPTPVTTIRPQC